MKTNPGSARGIELLEARIAPATLTWDGSASNLWNVAANWAENAVPQDGDLLVFPDAAANKSNTNDIAGLDLFAIQLNGSDYIIGGNALTISSTILGGTPTTNGAGPRLGTAITFTADGFIGNNGAHRIEIDGSVALGGHTLTINGSGGEIRIEGGITGDGALIKAGSNSTLIRNAASTFTGTTTVSSGRLILQTNSALGASGPGDSTSVSSGATLDFSTATSIADDLTIVGTGVSSAGAITAQSAGTHTLNGTLILAGDATVNAGTGSTIALAGGLSVDIDGAAVFETLTVAGSGLLTLGGPLTLGGTFQPASAASFTIVSTASGLSGTFDGLPDGATIRDGNRFFTVDYTATAVNLIALPVSIWDGGSSGGGANSNWTTAANWQGNVAPAAGSTLIFPEGASRLMNSNNFGLDTSFRQIVIEGGDYVIDGTRITLTNGLSGDASSIGASAPQFNVPIKLNGAQTFENRSVGPSGLNLPIRLGGDIDLNGFNLTLDGNVGMTLSGNIGSGGGLVKNGTNTVTLSGTDSIYGGVTAINAGVVVATTSNALGDSGDLNPTIVAAGAALRLQSAGTLFESVTISGTGVGGTGALVNLAGNNTLNATLTLAGTATLGITNAANTFTLDGNLAINVDGETPGTNLETLTLTGAGTLALSGGLTLEGDFIPAQGQEITVIDNTGTGAITGTFTGLADGQIFQNNGRDLQIDYQGGTGNDVTLIGQLPTFTWDGSAGLNWLNAANWTTDQAPQPGSKLVFPNTAGASNANNDFPAGTVFESILINKQGMVLGGNAIVLNAGISSGAAVTSSATVSLPITLGAGQTFMNNGPGLLQFDDPINLNGNTLTVNGNDDFIFNGALVGAGALVKNGAGVLSMRASNAYTGLTSVNAGELNVTEIDGLGATGPGNGTVVAAGARLDIGKDGEVFEELTLAGVGPGDGALGNGKTIQDQTLRGPLNVVSAAAIEVEPLAGTSSAKLTLAGPLRIDIDVTGADKLTVNTDSVTTFALTGALELSGTFQPAVGAQITILEREGGGTFTGMFTDLAEGATIKNNGREFTISYTGGDGNDVVLTTTKAAPTSTWDGGGADANWKTPANWVGDLAPTASSVLVFPAGAAQLTNTNDFAEGTAFHSIRIDGAGYTIGGNRLALLAGVDATLPGAGTAVALNTPITLAADQVFSKSGNLTFTIGGAINLNGRTLTEESAGPLQLSGIISGAGGMVKNGAGFLSVSGANTYTGTTRVNKGTLALFSGTALGATGAGNETIVASGGQVSFFSGSTFAEDFVISGANALEGVSFDFTLTGAVTLAGDASIRASNAGSLMLTGPLRLDIDGTTAGQFETLTYPFAVEFSGALEIGGSFQPAVGTTFKVVEKTAASAFDGSFDGLPEGTILNSGGRRFQISYTGGDGNDVVLTTVAPIDDLFISPDGKTATFGDVDGDRVTVKSSIGAFALDGSDFTLAPRANFQSQLQKLKLDADFKGTNISITAKPGPLGGNGFVNVGFIDAANVDLGSITIAGDLGRIQAGTTAVDSKVPALKSLTVESMGLLGVSTQNAGTLLSDLRGVVPKVTVKGDLRDANFLALGQDGKLGVVTIGGSVVGSASIAGSEGLGSLKVSGDIRTVGAGITIGSSGGPVGPVSVGGAIVGQQAFPVQFLGFGQDQKPASGLDLALKSLTVKGSVEFLKVNLGTDFMNANADASAGSISIGGDWIASSVRAGVDVGNDGQPGTNDDKTVIGSPPPRNQGGFLATVGSFTVKGQALGTADSTSDMFSVVAERIGTAKVGGRTFAFVADTPTTLNREAFFAGPTLDGAGQENPLFDFTIRELGSMTPNPTPVTDLDTSLGNVATLTDADGDQVTVTTSAGTFTNANFDVATAGVGGQLRTLTLGTAFAGADISITAKAGATGNGFVNVGFINANNVSLGNVSVGGDLGQIAANAAESLTVHSLGVFGTSTGANSTLIGVGDLGELTVQGDVRDSLINPTGAAGKVGSVKIAGLLNGGSLVADHAIGSVEIGGSALDALISSGEAIGAITIRGDLVGGGVTPTIVAFGQPTSPAKGPDLAVESLTVKGSVEKTLVQVGGGTVANADAAIGAVSIGRGWLASSVVAGAGKGFDNLIGTTDDDAAVGATSTRNKTAIFSTIASIVIKGQAFGSVATGDSFGIVAEQILKAKIGARTFKFDPGARDAADAFALAPTSPGSTGLPFDFFLREITA